MVHLFLKSVIIFIIILNLCFSLLLKNSSNNKEELFDEEISKRVKLYLPEYQNKYSRVNELNDTNFNFSKIRNSRKVFLIPDNIIDYYDYAYQRERISSIIDDFLYSDDSNDNKNKFKYNSIYSEDYTFYGNKNNFHFDHNYIWHKYISPNTEINDQSSSVINDLIETEPEMIYVDNQMCSVQKIIFHIKNPDKEMDLFIRNIKSDIHQIKIFPYLPSKTNYNNNKNLNITHTIPPKGTFVLQIFALPDIANIVYGTLYIEFNNKKVLLIPLIINGKESKYRVNPIYQINAQIKKHLSIPIKIFNPSQNILVIKKVMHSFEKINIMWANGSSVINNAHLPSSTMFQIQPRSSKNIIYIKYYSAFPYYEYGLIKLKTDNDMIVIPVLFNSILSPIITYPKFFNFGLCQIGGRSRSNFKKLIPLTLYNKGIENIKIGKVYLEYENIFIQFHQNFNGNNIIMAPNEEIKYGYLIFNGNIMKTFDKRKLLLQGKLQKGSIYIETNSTDCPLIQVNYSFLPDLENIEKIISGIYQELPRETNEFRFVININYTPPYGLEKMSNYNYGENMTILDEKYAVAKVINPLTKEQSHNVNIIFEIEKLDIFHYKRLFYIPLKLTHCLYSFIPVQIDNNDLNIIYCGNEENSKSLESCMRTFGSYNIFDNLKNTSHKIISFRFYLGAVCPGVKVQRFLYIINENMIPITLEDIKTDNKYVTLEIEGLEYLGNEDYSEIINMRRSKNINKLIKDNLMKRKTNKNIFVFIPPKVALKVSINLLTDLNENVSIKGKNTIIYNNNSKFVIDNTAVVFKGKINISPSNIRFEPAFPGLIQSLYIYCKNNIEIPLSLNSVSSSDERIIPSLLTYEVLPDNKTEIIKIIFDPSRTNLFKIFMNVIDFSTILTYKELYLWKEKEKFWNKLGETGRTEINANITLVTSFGKKEINANSFLIKPSLVKNDTVNFGLTQVGKLVNNYVEIYNPSDKVLMVKLVLVPNDYSDINNNEMFNIKDQNLLDINEELILLGCTFSGWVGNTLVTNFEYIILQEKIDPIDLRRGLIDKTQLIKLLYEYGNHKVKNYLLHGYNTFCKYEQKFKNELIVNNNYKNINTISELYSKDFEKEILTVKNMTTKDKNSENKKEKIKEETLWEKICGLFLKLYIKYYLHVSLNTEIEIKENNQTFYLPNSVFNQVYQISPHQKSTLGPIHFRPNQLGNITGTLFLKNNLTILYPVKLIGEGGGGVPSFFSNYEKNQLMNSHIINKTNYIIEVDEITYSTELKEKQKITRTITVKNTGNLLMNVKNISIDGYGCETDEMKILQCDEFVLYPEESLDIDIEIKPNINNYLTNKNVYFNTDYQTFNLNVIIFIAKDIYIKNNMIKNHVISMTLLLTIFIFFFIIIKTIWRFLSFYNNKKEDENENGNENEKNLIEKTEKEYYQDNMQNYNKKNSDKIYKNKKEFKPNIEINKKAKIKENNDEREIKKQKEKIDKKKYEEKIIDEENKYKNIKDENSAEENERDEKNGESEKNINDNKDNMDENNEEKNLENNNKKDEEIKYSKKNNKKNKRKKNNKRNRKKSETSNNSYTDNFSLDKNYEEKENKKEEKKEKDKEIETKDSNSITSNKESLEINIHKNDSKLSATPTMKRSKNKSLTKPFGMEDNDNNENKKNISSNDDKTNNEYDSTNEIKNTYKNKNNQIPNNRKRQNSNNFNNNTNTIIGLKEKRKPKSNISKKNNYDNNYYNYKIQEEKRQIVTVKRDNKINNLNDLFNKMSEEQYKKDKKEIKSEKTKDYQLKYNNKNKEEMKPIFLNDEKRNNVFNLEQELYKNNNDLNNISKIDIDCSSSIFNTEGLFFNKNDIMNTSKINLKDEDLSYEDIKEGEEIKSYFNKSLIEKIENPFYGDDKTDQTDSFYNADKSKFFNYDFFGDDNNNE